MKLLFLHQNFPGQFRHLAIRAATLSEYQVIGLGDQGNLELRPFQPGFPVLPYPSPKKNSEHAHHYLRGTEKAIRRGQAVGRFALHLKNRGFIPDLIVGHAAWGEMLFLRDIFPDSRMIGYFEFYYQPQGGDVDFDPEFLFNGLDEVCNIRTQNTTHLHSLQVCDLTWSPTRWQASRFPAVYADRMTILHDGIDTRSATPRADAVFCIGGHVLTAQDEVITYVSRGLEPYRGFHQLMRLLPDLLKKRPRARVVIVGEDVVYYGKPPVEHRNWREALLAEIGPIDSNRVFFTGRVSYRDYLAILQISAVHLYWTYPFVLSWSLLEAMSTGCAIVASNTPPVREVLEDGANGVLVNFFDRSAWLEQITRILEDQPLNAALRAKARATIVEGYDLHAIALPRQLAMLQSQWKLR
ncbi:MAG: glycosyltransferase [Magnetococcales bacterium]|nr:glycosyltransferase [Magnetococcales bacterium]